MKFIKLALLLFFIPGLSMAAEKIFNADFRNRPPQMVVDGDKFSGPLKDILEEASSKIGYTVKWRKAPFKRSLEGLKNGSVDIVPRYRKTPDREVFTNYLGPIGYQERNVKFVVLKSNKDIIKTYDDLKKYKVGVKRGTSYFKQFTDDKSIAKVETSDDEQIVKMLRGKRFEVAIIIDEGAFEHSAKKEGFTDWAYAPYEFVRRLPNYYGMSKTSPNAGEYDALNAAIKGMATSGRVKEIYMQYNVEPPVQ
ncbi:substrate-binding periplasmic protein [Vibrio marisflavi]|uniref:Solute-binding protein family 3/N-terminal domain-containing protein n=1 Tax=Vibrio marisflavi CECT 7928 TaxID=634439 RepID=A0ABM9A169_9VIBR|nr:ABC transporter substrate-binding protein [Vibrio marisflavi]CAH0537337.1 hypothetical protein VMF7928_01059 [Vibrio marisflavi CECT 7928]